VDKRLDPEFDGVRRCLRIYGQRRVAGHRRPSRGVDGGVSRIADRQMDHVPVLDEIRL